MSDVTIRIPTPLRSFTRGAGEVQVSAATVGEALEVLGLRHQGILERILDADGQVRGFVNIFVDGESIRSLDGLGSSVDGAKVISIVPAVAGGGAS